MAPVEPVGFTRRKVLSLRISGFDNARVAIRAEPHSGAGGGLRPDEQTLAGAVASSRVRFRKLGAQQLRSPSGVKLGAPASNFARRSARPPSPQF